MTADDKTHGKVVPKVDTRHIADSTNAPPMVKRMSDKLDSRIPRMLRFSMVDTPAVFQVPMQDEIVVGRQGDGKQKPVDIDCGPFEARERGVSRRHVAIFVDNGRMTVKDLHSTNGTQLNGFALEAGQHYRLRHGDELKLGNMRLRVFFQGLVL